MFLQQVNDMKKKQTRGMVGNGETVPEQKRFKSRKVPLKCIVWACLKSNSNTSVVKRLLLETVIEYPVLDHGKELLLYFKV